MEKVINGSDLVVKLGGDTILCSTSCTLNVNMDTIDVACKSGDSDVGWKGTLPGNKSWDISTDGLYVESTSTSNSATMKDLFDDMVAGSKVSLTFTEKSPTTGDNTYTGEAYITSWSINAPDGEVATYSVTFNGTGALSVSVTV